MNNNEILEGSNWLESIRGEITGWPKWKLVELNKEINKVREEKFVRRKEPIYSNLTRDISKKDLEIIFRNIKDETMRKYFLIQFFYALRVSEVKTLEIDLNNKLIKIQNAKANRTEFLPIFEGTEVLFKNIEDFKNISHDHYRNKFRIICSKINYKYGIAKDGRSLNLYTTHSLRHTGITLFNDYLHDPIKVMKYSRHKDKSTYGCLPTYIHYNLNKMRLDLKEAFKEYLYLAGTLPSY